MKAFIDTNVVLDLLLKRKPFFSEARDIITIKDYDRTLELIISSVSVTNIAYIARKTGDVYDILESLTMIFDIAPTDKKIVNQAIELKWKDFEDAVQYCVAKEINADVFITRNVKDFKSVDGLRIWLPSDFLDYYSNTNK